MTPDFALRYAIRPSLELLPIGMSSPAGTAMVLAIALQESRLQNRTQIGGPARSYWQFEVGGGVRGVLNHVLSKPHAQRLLAMLDYDPTSDAVTVHNAMQHNDVLAAGFARLLLWTSPEALPGRDRADRGWDIYQSVWRPGRARPDSWPGYFNAAWALV